MADGVFLDRLDEIIDELKSTIDEFDDASEISKDMAATVGKPMDRSDLHDKVRDFENDWNKHRGDLKENLEAINENLTNIRDGFKGWDEKTQQAFLNSQAKDVPKAKK